VLISVSNSRKSHALVLPAVIAVGSATATVEVRDNLDIFKDLSMQGDRVTGLETPASDKDAATKKYVDESGGCSVFYGDGSDGQITDSYSKNCGGMIHATTYTLKEGSTVSLNRQYLVIKATESITINGKIDGKEASKNGGAGSWPVNHPSRSGSDRGFQGAGGQGASYEGITTRNAPGADGGGGGGVVALMAPEISVSGEIDVSGGDGGDSSGGGAGGGGSGGLILLHTDTLSEQTPTYNVSGGSGGKGSGSKGYKSGDGADGADGELIKAVQ